MIRILFDGPPGNVSGRFIEVENEKGEGISFGEWVQDGDYWVLQFPDNAALINRIEILATEKSETEQTHRLELALLQRKIRRLERIIQAKIIAMKHNVAEVEGK